MAINLDWFKSTGLMAAQSAAHAFLGVSGGDLFNLFHVDWKGALGISGGAALGAVLHAIVTYRIPSDSKASPEVLTADPAPAAAAPAAAPTPAVEPAPAAPPAAAAVDAAPAADVAPAT